jgi:hypothetical protein
MELDPDVISDHDERRPRGQRRFLQTTMDRDAARLATPRHR